MNRLLLLLGCLSALLGLVQAAPLAIDVQSVFSGQTVQLDSMKYKTAEHETLGFSRISLLLSGFALETETGEWIELENRSVYLDATTHRLDARLGNMPAGTFRALRFAIGPAPEQNHSDPAQYAADHPLNPVLNNLLWDWQTGYIFMALEGRFQTLEKPTAGYVLHYANDWNRSWINLPLQLEGSTPSVLNIQFDLAALFNTPSPISLSTDGHITHSREDDPLATALRQNLPAAFQLKDIVTLTTAAEKKAPVPPLYLPKQFEAFPFTMSRTFPIPALPQDNPLIKARVELGEKLFNDKLLSADHTISCASCHKTEHAFTDALTVSTGINNLQGTRNAMPLFNLAWKKEFFWDGRAPSLRKQVLEPITNKVEMANDYATVIQRLEEHPDYPALFEKAFSPPEPTTEKMALALEAYLITLVSDNSHFDQARKGESKLTTEEQRGMELFFTEYDPRTRQYGADCFHCHGGALFTDHQFHNNGLEKTTDLGRFKTTKKERDRFKFSTPSLRNVARTAPYMHDGRFQTLEEVIDHYTSPLEPSDTLDPNLAKHPETGLQLSEEDKSALVTFLKTLSDPAYQ